MEDLLARLKEEGVNNLPPVGREHLRAFVRAAGIECAAEFLERLGSFTHLYASKNADFVRKVDTMNKVLEDATADVRNDPDICCEDLIGKYIEQRIMEMTVPSYTLEGQQPDEYKDPIRQTFKIHDKELELIKA